MDVTKLLEYYALGRLLAYYCDAGLGKRKLNPSLDVPIKATKITPTVDKGEV